jgi:hypothetical protein
VGTDNYRSPEHMTKGGVPTTESDVFTCGLMLYELLAGVHPYWSEEQADYAKLVRAYAAKPPALLGTMPAPAGNAPVSAVLHRCLSPDPAARPTAKELADVLSGRGAKPTAAPAAATARTPAAPTKAAHVAAPTGEPIVADGIELVGADGKALQVGIRTELGKALMRQFGADAEFWDDRQCVLERQAGRQWLVSPVAGTVNETLVNGQAITAPRVLRQGDQIAVGRQARGIVKLPLRARAR